MLKSLSAKRPEARENCAANYQRLNLRECLAVQAVQSYPVSASKSLLTGKKQGKAASTTILKSVDPYYRKENSTLRASSLNAVAGNFEPGISYLLGVCRDQARV